MNFLKKLLVSMCASAFASALASIYSSDMLSMLFSACLLQFPKIKLIVDWYYFISEKIHEFYIICKHKSILLKHRCMILTNNLAYRLIIFWFTIKFTMIKLRDNIVLYYVLHWFCGYTSCRAGISACFPSGNGRKWRTCASYGCSITNKIRDYIWNKHVQKNNQVIVLNALKLKFDSSAGNTIENFINKGKIIIKNSGIDISSKYEPIDITYSFSRYLDWFWIAHLLSVENVGGIDIKKVCNTFENCLVVYKLYDKVKLSVLNVEDRNMCCFIYDNKAYMYTDIYRNKDIDVSTDTVFVEENVLFNEFSFYPCL